MGRATDSSLRNQVIREGLRLGESGIHFGVGSGIAFRSSAGTEEWNELARSRRRWRHMLALARQGSATRNVDRQRNRLDRSHDAGSGNSSKEFQRERSCVRKGSNNGGKEQQCGHNGVTQQWMNKGIAHCCQ